MNKWCFLLMAACLLAPDTGHAALKARDDVKAEDAFNPNPAPDDLILPMPCGQSMVLKAVGVRGKGLLWDLETRFVCVRHLGPVRAQGSPSRLAAENQGRQPGRRRHAILF